MCIRDREDVDDDRSASHPVRPRRRHRSIQIGLQKHLLNLGAKYIGKMIPKYNLPKAVPFMQTVSGSNEYLTPSHSGKGNDVALILYTALPVLPRGQCLVITT